MPNSILYACKASLKYYVGPNPYHSDGQSIFGRGFNLSLMFKDVSKPENGNC